MHTIDEFARKVYCYQSHIQGLPLEQLKYRTGYGKRSLDEACIDGITSLLDGSYRGALTMLAAVS